jgi:hypothetical protein
MFSNSYLDKLKQVFSNVRELSASETKSFRDAWRHEFMALSPWKTPHSGSCCYNTRKGFDWNYFASKRFPSRRPNFRRLEAETKRDDLIVVFGEPCDKPGIVVSFSEALSFLEKNPWLEEDVYFVAKNLNWMIAFTHHPDFGPFLVFKGYETLAGLNLR